MLKDYPKSVIKFYNEIRQLSLLSHFGDITIIDLGFDRPDKGASVEKKLNINEISINKSNKGKAYWLIHELLHIKYDIELGSRFVKFKNGDKNLMCDKSREFIKVILVDFVHHYLIAKEIFDDWSEVDDNKRLLEYIDMLNKAFEKYGKLDYKLSLYKLIEIIGLLANGKIQQNDFYEDYQIPKCENNFIENAAERIYQCIRNVKYNKDSFKLTKRKLFKVLREILNEINQNINIHDYILM